MQKKSKQLVLIHNLMNINFNKSYELHPKAKDMSLLFLKMLQGIDLKTLQQKHVKE